MRRDRLIFTILFIIFAIALFTNLYIYANDLIDIWGFGIITFVEIIVFLFLTDKFDV